MTDNWIPGKETELVRGIRFKTNETNMPYLAQGWGWSVPETLQVGENYSYSFCKKN